MPVVNENSLKKVIIEILKKAGSDEGEASIVADHLVMSNLCGHDSHGLICVPIYLEHISQGVLKPNMPAKLIKDDGAILVFDGQRGFGQRTAREAMDKAISKCREKGLAVMALRNAHHIGRVGAYGEQSIRAGMVSLHFVNVIGHEPLVVPFGGRDARIATNPVCIAMPGTDQTDPIILDMATSKIPMGKVRVAIDSGESLGDDLILDRDGFPTNDPAVMLEAPGGSLLPFGLHKGYGIALFCELLGGVLTGGGTTLPKTQTIGGIINNMLVFLVDPRRLGDHQWMRCEFDEMIKYTKESRPQDPRSPVMVANEPEMKSLHERRANGIPLLPAIWERVLEAAEGIGIERSKLESFVA
jgi:uncharacterized oxidoreductase